MSDKTSSPKTTYPNVSFTIGDKKYTLKLFFPHADSVLIRTQKFKQEFDKYCLTPAKSMQETVLKQMRFVNPGMFPDGNLGFSTYTVRWDL